MKEKIKHTILFISLLLSINSLYSQDSNSDTKPRHKSLFGFHSLSDTLEKEKSGVFVLPLVYYSPDTRWAFGGAGVYYFKIPSKNKDEMETRVSNIQFLADYTQNRQLDIWG